jgi:phosphoglycolate phosphatase
VVIRAVLIDLDGTLVDTANEIMASANAMLTAAAQPPVDLKTINETVGEGAAMLVEHLLGAGSVERWLPVYLEHYRAHNGSSATLYPNVKEGLAALRAMAVSIGCVTNKPRDLVGPLLDRLGILSSFDTIVGGGDTVEKKPKPAPILEACRRLEVDPAHAVMIGDSINDALAANAAGAISLTVPYGYPGSAGEAGRAAALLERGLTRAVVGDLADAARWIAGHDR